MLPPAVLLPYVPPGFLPVPYTNVIASKTVMHYNQQGFTVLKVITL